MTTAQRLRRSVHGLRRVSARPGDEPVDIGPLISPLRYDVLVRAQFFRFLERNLDLADRDFAQFLGRARAHPYFVWCERVALARHHPRLAADPVRAEAYFAERVRRSHALWTSFRSAGFDPAHPVVLRAARPCAPTDSGKTVRRPLHVGDGGHRLALLLAAGTRMLPPDHYRVDQRVLTTVPDNTARLLGPLALAEPDYAAFLSLGYADRAIRRLPALVEHVRETRPGMVAELLDVIEHDRRYLPA